MDNSHIKPGMVFDTFAETNLEVVNEPDETGGFMAKDNEGRIYPYYIEQVHNLRNGEGTHKDGEIGHQFVTRFFLTTTGFNWTVWWITEKPDMYDSLDPWQKEWFSPAMDGTTISVQASLHFTRDAAYQYIWDTAALLSNLDVKSVAEAMQHTYYLPDLTLGRRLTDPS